jgi:hypothetical protein
MRSFAVQSAREKLRSFLLTGARYPAAVERDDQDAHTAKRPDSKTVPNAPSDDEHASVSDAQTYGACLPGPGGDRGQAGS